MHIIKEYSLHVFSHTSFFLLKTSLIKKYLGSTRLHRNLFSNESYKKLMSHAKNIILLCCSKRNLGAHFNVPQVGAGGGERVEPYIVNQYSTERSHFTRIPMTRVALFRTKVLGARNKNLT